MVDSADRVCPNKRCSFFVTPVTARRPHGSSIGTHPQESAYLYPRAQVRIPWGGRGEISTSLTMETIVGATVEGETLTNEIPNGVAEVVLVRHGETTWNALGRIQLVID
ncbi:hypothetical protein Scep_011053 [Stephania cephalantha]|uniref:Phosphoglycerate mutase n=1 Tax=Stephania cephalantha TaxID=152367 RepID=A0AAP0JWC5_9MAGN